MKENIDNKFVLNRKIVIEIRFSPNPRILDLRGTIIKAFEPLNLHPIFHWELGDLGLVIKDSPDMNVVRNQILVDLNKFAFICSKIDSIESFYSKFNKIYETIKLVIGDFTITRIGCRIQGTYSVKSFSFESILSNFKKVFTAQIFLDDFPVNDLRFQVNYQNGMYQTGPINENDEFVKKEFPFLDRNKKIGIGIDTDNYLLNSNNEDLNKPTKIKDVLIASLAVEKSLYEKMKDF